MPEITDSCTGEVIKGALVTVDVDVLQGRIRQAYHVAQRSTHAGGRVELHIGSAVFAYLDSRMPDPWTSRNRTFWGFPVVVHAEPHQISVHVVHDIA